MGRQAIRALVLSAGKSSRFETEKSKQLFSLCGRPMILYPVHQLLSLNISATLVVGHQAHALKQVVNDAGFTVDFVEQPQLLGTGDAVLRTQSTWNDAQHLLILNGDMPLVTQDLLQRLCKKHFEANAAISFVSSQAFDPTGYGRVIQKDNGFSIVEEKECTDEQRAITKINAGIYLMNKKFVSDTLCRIEQSKLTGEFYLPELIEKASHDNLTVIEVVAPFDTIRGVNTLEDLWEVEQIKRSELIKHWMYQGVHFLMPQTVHIDVDVTIAPDTFIGAGVQLLKGTSIGKKCTIQSYAILSNATLEDGVTIEAHSVIADSVVKTGCRVGPFARLRDNVTLEKDVVVGNFVEIKKSSIGHASKAKHLTYLGDATVGGGVNIGAGTITCNHDGFEKHKTVIKEGAYVGSNTTLVAPVCVEKNAFVAAGSVVTNDVPENDLAIGRARQVNKKGYAARLRRRKVKGTHDTFFSHS